MTTCSSLTASFPCENIHQGNLICQHSIFCFEMLHTSNVRQDMGLYVMRVPYFSAALVLVLCLVNCRLGALMRRENRVSMSTTLAQPSSAVCLQSNLYLTAVVHLTQPYQLLPRCHLPLTQLHSKQSPIYLVPLPLTFHILLFFRTSLKMSALARNLLFWA